MLWIKAFHIVFLVTWFAGLFYLPRIFVYHVMAEENATRETFKIMQGKLMVMTHLGAALTWLSGLSMFYFIPAWLTQGWLQIKLGLVILLMLYHWWCAAIVKEFARDEIRHGHVWYRWFNEFPTLILISVVILVVLKPF